MSAAELRRTCAVVTKPGDPGGYRGEYDCGDCCSMTHCETHHKDEGTYPFDGAEAMGLETGTEAARLERWRKRAEEAPDDEYAVWLSGTP